MNIMGIYYYDRSIFTKSTGDIDYVKINDITKNIVSRFSNIQAKLIKQNGINGGSLYINRNYQGNNIDNKYNNTSILTITTDEGIIVYMLNFFTRIFSKGDKYISKPIYTSGNYLGKNIIIVQEVLDNTDEKVGKITIFSYF